MAPAISMRGAGVQFRMWRRNRARRPSPVGQGRRWRFWGLRDVTLELGTGELVGVIGPNGAGKTTLMKLAAGIFHPDEGEVTVVGRVAPLLSPLAGLHPRLSGWDNIRLSGVLLGLSRRQACEVAPEVAEFSALGRFLDAPARTYSAGMKARLGFAVSIFCEADILLYDEVLAFGDQEFHDRSSAKLRQLRDEGRTVLLASHDIAGLVDSTDRMLWVEAGHMVELGEPAEVAERYLATRPAAPDESSDSPS